MVTVQLVELTYEELEIPEARAKTIPVAVLRMMLRENRKEQKERDFDPMTNCPDRFAKISKEDLRKECDIRGIEWDEKMTNPKLMQLILEKVEAYQWAEAAKEDMEIVEEEPVIVVDPTPTSTSSSSRCPSPSKDKKMKAKSNLKTVRKRGSF